VLPVDASGAAAGQITTIRVDLGARALAIDTKDNLLVVSNEGSGTLVLVDLASNTVVGRIHAVQTSMTGDDNQDDHSDRNSAGNAPAIQTIVPASGKVGATVNVTITGANLGGAAAVQFIDTSSLPGNGKGDGKGDENKNTDRTITVTNIQASAGGTQLTCSVAISANAQPGPRLVKVITPNGDTSGKLAAVATFTVIP
jgi:hypothetical protein